MTGPYDVLIIGGGLVGASLACALESLIHQNGLKVVMIETHSLDEPRARPPSFDARSSALSYGTRLIYDRLGLWQGLKNKATAIQHVHISDRGHFGVTRLDHHSEGVPALGYVIDNFLLGDALLERLNSYREQGTIDTFSPAEVITVKSGQNCQKALVRSPEGQEQWINTSLVALADGGRSGLMEQLNLEKTIHDYGQYALIANVAVDRPHKGIAYERFAGKGPMALLPKMITEEAEQNNNHHHFGLVWTLSDNEVDEMTGLDDRAFLAQLQDRFGFRAGRFLRVGQRDCYPLQMSLAREQVRPGLVVLGNAAHAIHPVAGQGYNLAIRDVMALTENIKGSLIQGQPVGELSRLMQYLQTQEGDQKRTVAFCDGLVKLFSRSESSVVLARNLGLLGLELGGSLKSQFARAAMGI
ncbi:2-octaprenyl-6-methoxyphenyl hydroxylase [Endozoicomonas sp. Mp262]|uniref:2-octaprenyl-6-methoxyphenyl hydroxylase n=1 Tax=Endozoicomonas sp. Mp262 TaxID=2919499 RepID=UPI0021D91017